MLAGPPAASRAQARRARERFVAEVEAVLEPLAQALADRLIETVDRSASTREAQERRDATLEFERLRAGWVTAARLAWRRGASGLPAAPPPTAPREALALIDHDEVEKSIVASRLAMALQEQGGWDLTDLLRRLQHLEAAELPADDVLRPEGLALRLVEAWMGAGLPRRTWLLAGDLFQQQLGPVALAAWQRLNEDLIAAGVLPDIAVAHRVRRSADAAAARASPGAGAGGRGGAGGAPGGGAAGAVGRGPGGGSVAGSRVGLGGPSLAQVQRPAAIEGLLGRVRRLLADRVTGFVPGHPVAPSPGLVAAFGVASGPRRLAAGTTFDDATVSRVAQALREQTGELKRQAGTASEKALIEVVALMFQSILAEERIPPSVRVWFARLQMPVLRVALGEPDFFESLQHPARLLIDRMGACVLGFDAAAIDGSEMEAEIRRIVQVIEQYPETGRQVFLLAYEEFEGFLARYLTEQPPAARRLVSVAQQVEQKETLAVRYTIELRRLLDDMPVPAGVRDFLFKVWAEVMAVAAVRQGAQHPDTLALKKSASALVWAAGAKPSRAERAQVIQGLPALLQRLRQGMGLLGLPATVQEAQIKALSDSLADAFQARTAPIPSARIEAITQRLENLDSLAQPDDTDLPLDAAALVVLLGEAAHGVEVIADGGLPASPQGLAWARQLQPGAWFQLSLAEAFLAVQYAWRSEGGHLHLFTGAGERCWLLQSGRLAGYLQAGLLLPREDEALTVRATREALAQLDADPQRLLASD